MGISIIFTLLFCVIVDVESTREYFTQRVDHFDPLNTAVWQQTYYVNESFWTPGNVKSPIFLCMGGEGPPLNDSVISSSMHCNNAVEFASEVGALVLALEHRYYTCHNASACPVPSISRLEDYRYFSMVQALQDSATFHRFISSKYQLTKRNRWITFGGSYPGIIASYARLRFPNLFYASVASSAPVQATLTMAGFNDVVSRSYANSEVGGSPECRNKIADGHAKIKEYLSSVRGQAELGAIFDLPPNSLVDIEKQWEFCGNGVAYFPCQENDPVCDDEACNIAKICDIMLRGSTSSMQALAAVRKAQLSLKRNEKGSYFQLGGDLWNWQVCNEWGFFQTCDVGSECMFTQGLTTLDKLFNMSCSAFGMNNISVVRQNVENILNTFGGRDISVSKVLWVNAGVDPWISQSIVCLTEEQKRAGQKIIFVPGASHHAWTHPSRDDDQLSVKQARIRIREVIRDWLIEKSVSETSRRSSTEYPPRKTARNHSRKAPLRVSRFSY